MIYARRDARPCVYPLSNHPQHRQQHHARPQSNLFRKPKSISSFIAEYKSVINSQIDDYIDKSNSDIPKYNRNNHFFRPNYHDHIIRNVKTLGSFSLTF